MSPLRRTNEPATGFTLLEVILALAILAGAVAVLGEVMSLANRNARDAEAESQAQLLAASAMYEMLTGIEEFESISRQTLTSESSTPWVYSVSISSTDFQNLIKVEVLVEQDLEQKFNPVKYQLTRWVSTVEESQPQPTPENEEI